MRPEEKQLPDEIKRFGLQFGNSPPESSQAENACCVVLVTCPTHDVAREISRAVVAAKHAACVNLIPGVTSIYEWEGRLCEEAEVLLLMKTQAANLDGLYQQLKSLHPYTVPEFIVLPVSAGSEPYLDWLRRATPSIV
jgi:periplasmic divalent cation tolerance protein